MLICLLIFIRSLTLLPFLLFVIAQNISRLLDFAVITFVNPLKYNFLNSIFKIKKLLNMLSFKFNCFILLAMTKSCVVFIDLEKTHFR